MRAPLLTRYRSAHLLLGKLALVMIIPSGLSHWMLFLPSLKTPQILCTVSLYLYDSYYTITGSPNSLAFPLHLFFFTPVPCFLYWRPQVLSFCAPFSPYSAADFTNAQYSPKLTACTAIGIYAWFAPQISLHWPKNVPSLRAIKLVWFSRPGIASIFTPNDGTAQLCSTSAAVTITLTCVSTGTTTLFVTSNSRNSPIAKSLSGTIYESKLICAGA